jgi:ABC-2 type transport system permease protein
MDNGIGRQHPFEPGSCRRSGVLAVPIVVGFAVAAVLVVALYSSFDIVDYVLFLALTVLFGATFVSIAVGISAATKSTTKAAASVFGVFVLFEFLWSVIPAGIYYLVEGSIFPVGRPPNWYLFVQQLSPSNAFSASVLSFLPNTQRQLAAMLGGDVPFYLTDWFAIVILAFWLVVPVTLGYLAFERKDL